MYDKYKQLQKKLKKLIIRAKQWTFTNANGDEQEWRVSIDINGEMKLQDININDISLLNTNKKQELEDEITACFQKAQDKAQEVVSEKTKETLGFDPSDMASMMWWWGWWMPKMPWM